MSRLPTSPTPPWDPNLFTLKTPSQPYSGVKSSTKSPVRVATRLTRYKLVSRTTMHGHRPRLQLAGHPYPWICQLPKGTWGDRSPTFGRTQRESIYAIRSTLQVYAPPPSFSPSCSLSTSLTDLQSPPPSSPLTHNISHTVSHLYHFHKIFVFIRQT